VEYPKTYLKNEDLKLTISIPDETSGYYRGSRFDWSGIITRAEYRGHCLIGEWKDNRDPTNHDDLTGTAGEFSMFDPLAYEDAKPGETFIKIGIGRLEKDADKPYRFNHNYTISAPAPWSIKDTEDSIEFQQYLSDKRGWGYSYKKTITLKTDGFIIRHALKNTGSRNILTDHYCHNFFCIDGTEIGPDYRIVFPFKLTGANNRNGGARFEDNVIVFATTLTQENAFFAELRGYSLEGHNAFSIENTSAQVGLHITGDKAPEKINVWAVDRAICPEAFVKIEIPVGGEFSWTHSYRPYEIAD